MMKPRFISSSDTNKLQVTTSVRSSSVLNHRLEFSSALLCTSLYVSLQVLLGLYKSLGGFLPTCHWRPLQAPASNCRLTLSFMQMFPDEEVRIVSRFLLLLSVSTASSPRPDSGSSFWVLEISGPIQPVWTSLHPSESWQVLVFSPYCLNRGDKGVGFWFSLHVLFSFLIVFVSNIQLQLKIISQPCWLLRKWNCFKVINDAVGQWPYFKAKNIWIFQPFFGNIKRFWNKFSGLWLFKPLQLSVYKPQAIFASYKFIYWTNVAEQ